MSNKNYNKVGSKRILLNLVSIFGTLLLINNLLAAPNHINNEVLDINVNEEVKISKIDTNITDTEVNQDSGITNNSNFLLCDANRDCKVNQYLPLGVQISLSLLGLIGKNNDSGNNVYDRGIAGIEVPGKPPLVDPVTLRIRAVPTLLPMIVPGALVNPVTSLLDLSMSSIIPSIQTSLLPVESLSLSPLSFSSSLLISSSLPFLPLPSLSPSLLLSSVPMYSSFSSLTSSALTISSVLMAISLIGSTVGTLSSSIGISSLITGLSSFTSISGVIPRFLGSSILSSSILTSLPSLSSSLSLALPASSLSVSPSLLGSASILPSFGVSSLHVGSFSSITSLTELSILAFSSTLGSIFSSSTLPFSLSLIPTFPIIACGASSTLSLSPFLSSFLAGTLGPISVSSAVSNSIASISTFSTASFSSMPVLGGVFSIVSLGAVGPFLAPFFAIVIGGSSGGEGILLQEHLP